MKRQHITTTLMPDTYKKLELISKTSGMTMGQVIDMLVYKQKRIKLF